MKRIMSILLVACFALFPMLINAAEKINLEDYKSLNFKDTLKSEGIDLAYDKYVETSDQATIYMFRGQRCGYCKAFLNFLNNQAKEYGKYFKLVSFETWQDSNNGPLLTEISAFLNNPAQGVPYIIIGDQVFPGYSSDFDKSILDAITSLYESKDRYDVFEAYNEKVKADSKASGGNTTVMVICDLLFTVVAVVFVIFYINVSNRRLLETLSDNEVKPFDIMGDEEDADKQITPNEEKKLRTKKVAKRK